MQPTHQFYRRSLSLFVRWVFLTRRTCRSDQAAILSIMVQLQLSRGRSSRSATCIETKCTRSDIPGGSRMHSDGPERCCTRTRCIAKAEARVQKTITEMKRCTSQTMASGGKTHAIRLKRGRRSLPQQIGPVHGRAVSARHRAYPCGRIYVPQKGRARAWLYTPSPGTHVARQSRSAESWTPRASASVLGLQQHLRPRNALPDTHHPELAHLYFGFLC